MTEAVNAPGANGIPLMSIRDLDSVRKTGYLEPATRNLLLR